MKFSFLTLEAEVRILLTFLTLFISLPLWLYLVHGILVAINAHEGLWFAFYFYQPVMFFSVMLAEVLRNKSA